MERIAGLPDNDLLRMVYLDSAHYQSEAITYAKAEMVKRGVNPDPLDLSRISNPEVLHPFIRWARRFRRSTWTIVQTRAYAIGLATGGLIFMLLNLLSYRLMVKTAICCHFLMSFGFPLIWHTSGGYVGETYLHWWNVVADIAAGILMCLVFGWLFNGLVRKIRFYLESA